MNAIEVKNYSFTYDGLEAPTLKNVNFQLEYGELAVLAGLSGEGKSTLLSSLNGVIPNFTKGTQEGDILVNGESILGKTIAAISAAVGSVLQNADTQIVHDIVEDEIAFACENLCFATEKIEEQVEYGCSLMNLELGAKTQTLSGGQKQRLITATTLAMGQKILLLDEPLANLDVSGANKLMQTLRMLAKEQDYAVLIVEHRLDMVTPYLDRILWMEQGQLRQLEPGERPDKAMQLTCRREGAPGEVILQAEGLCYAPSGKTILKDAGITVRGNERIVITGENGSGKTTLLRLVSGLLKPDSGIVSSPWLTVKRGKPIFNSSWYTKVGVIEQNPNYQLFMPTVQEEILYRAASPEWAETLIREFDFDALRDLHPQSLSEGQKRKLSIMAILAMKPGLILMDEPTVGQDIHSLQMLLRVLDLCRQDNRQAQVIVTHDQQFARCFAQRIIQIKDGCAV